MSPCWDDNYLIALGQRYAIGQFIEYLEHEKGMPAKTSALYCRYISQLLDYFVKKASQERIRPFWANCGRDILSSYYLYLIDKGENLKMLNRKMAAIDSFFDFMVSKGYLAKPI
jgi:site-specific recombinase XerC